MNALEKIRSKKLQLALDICETKAKLNEMFEQMKHLEVQETELYEDFFGTVKCDTHDFNKKKNKDRRGKTNAITEKFKTLSREEQAKLLQLLTLGE